MVNIVVSLWISLKLMFFSKCCSCCMLHHPGLKRVRRERNLRGMFCLCTVLSLLCSRGAYVFHTCSLCLIVFFSLCELVFHCIHLRIHRSHSLVLILLWVVCAWLKLLSLGVCFSAHNVNLLCRQVKHCFSILNYCVCFLHGQQCGPMLVTVWLFLEMVMAVAMSH